MTRRPAPCWLRWLLPAPPRRPLPGAAGSTAGDPLEDLAAPGRAALLVIDVQNDRCHDEGAYGRMGVSLAAIQQAVERLLVVVEAARDAGVPVIFVKTH
ncbi:MAG: isochorismatase family protein, partial [Candidatus Rokuibacteriota bacterium]